MKVCVYRHLSLTASLTVLVLHRHGVNYYNNTSAPKNVVVAEDFLKTLPLSLYISDLDVSVLVQPLYVAYLTMEITKNSKKLTTLLLIALLLKHMPSLTVYSFLPHFLVFSR